MHRCLPRTPEQLDVYKRQILNLVDGTNIERNLYLSTQLMELGIPVVMAVNMIDIVNKNGDKINVAKLAEKLGCPVVEISALKLTGIENATKKAIELAQKKSAAAVSYTHLAFTN